MSVRALALLASMTLGACPRAEPPGAQTAPRPRAPEPAEPAPQAAGARLDPDLPAPAPELAGAAAALRALVLDLDLRCFVDRGFAVDGPADPRCVDAAARLRAGGPAAAHAVGGYLLRPTDAELGAHRALLEGSAVAFRRSTGKLLELLRDIGDPAALPFLLAFSVDAVRRAPSGTSEVLLALDGLARITQNDVAPIARWQLNDRTPADLERAVAAWRDWHVVHGREAPGAWATAGRAAALSRLRSADPVARAVAIERLARVPEVRVEVEASLAELLRSPGLGEYPRRTLLGLAEEYGLEVSAAPLRGELVPTGR